MKRKMRRIASLLALLLLVQTGCVPAGLGPGVEQPPTEEPAPFVSDTPVPTPSAAPTPTPSPSPEVPEPEVTPEARILDSKQSMDEEGVLWHIPNERVEQWLQQDLAPLGEHLLLYGSEPASGGGGMGVDLAVLSLETGGVLHEMVLPDIGLPGVQVWGSVVAVADWMDGDIYLLDDTLDIILEYRPERSAYGGAYVSPDLNTVYYVTQMDGIQVVDLNSGETRTLLENTWGLYSAGLCGDAVSLSYTDLETQMSCCAVLDLAAGTVEEIPFEGSFYNVECSGDLWMAGVMGADGAYYLGRSERPNVFYFRTNSGMVNLLNDPSRILFTEYDENGNGVLSLYEADGTFLSRCSLATDWSGPYSDPTWSEKDGGYYFLVTDYTGKDLLLFWDLAVPLAGENLELVSAYEGTPEPEGAVSQSLYDRADRIQEKYGFEVLIAEQCRQEFNQFTAVREMSEWYITAALDDLETVLASYPEGLTEQLLYGVQREIEVHLVGSLTKTDLPEQVSGFSTFSGFVSAGVGKSVLVVDITRPGSLKQTLYHEMTHLIDHKLAFDAGLREDAVYSEEGWNALNPEGFVYPDTYDELPMEIFTDGYESWFIDTYSRTYAKEDRARIMEYAMMGNEWAFSASPGRMAKLEYLCRCIRDCFDTTGWPEQTQWEMTLEQAGYMEIKAVG